MKMEALIQGWLSIWLYVMAGIGIYLGVMVWKNRKRWDSINILCTLAVMFGFCFLLINLPEMLLGDKNSPYAFTDRGYYEQYGEEYEAEHNIDY